MRGSSRHDLSTSLSEGALEGVLTSEAAGYVASGVSALLRASDGAENGPETVSDQPRRGFNGKRSTEAPSVRKKRERIERGEQQASIHLVAAVEFGRNRYVLCECGFGCGDSSDQAMAEAFSRHSFDNSTDNG